MCLICTLIEKDKLTSSEAYRAAGGGEYKVHPAHAGDLIDKIEELRRKEESKTFNPDDDHGVGD